MISGFCESTKLNQLQQNVMQRLFTDECVCKVLLGLRRFVKYFLNFSYDEQHQPQARLLSVLLLLFIPIGGIIILYRWHISQHNPMILVIGGGIMVGFIIAFLISRTRYFHAAGLVTVALITGACVVSIALNLKYQAPLSYIGFSSLVAILILPARFALVISILNIIVAIIASQYASHLTALAVEDDLVFLMTLTFVVWIMVLVRRYDLHELMLKHQEMLEMKEQQLKLELEKKKVRLLANFVEDISHDIRTPLSIIQTSTYLLTKQTPSQNHTRLEMIDNQAIFLTRMFDNLLSMTKLDDTATSLNLKRVNISQLLEEIYEELLLETQDKNQSLQIDLTPYSSDILGDRFELRRCFTNILQNAIAYTPKGGTISIKTTNQQNMIKISIQDTGIGISKEDLPHIFERLYRADKTRTFDGNDNGSGLGLAIAKRVIELHEGNTSVMSEAMKGTHFIIRLPTVN